MATKLNLVLDAGSTFTQEIQLLDENDDPLVVSVTMAANASMKKSYQTSNVIVFDVTLANGSLRLDMDANVSIDVIPGRYVWDAVITNSSDDSVNRIVEGIVTVTPKVSDGD